MTAALSRENQLINDYLHHPVPVELIAQEALAPRSAARLMVLDQDISHHHFYDLPQLLKAGDLLIFNNTKVVPARLYLKREQGSLVETVFSRWEGSQGMALVKGLKRLKEGEALSTSDGQNLTFLKREGDQGVFACEAESNILSILMRNGVMPLPPYIKREIDDQRHQHDIENYQNVFAQQTGAIAAPTAGLHFDEDLLSALEQTDIQHSTLTLHVGLGTFKNIEGDFKDHQMHAESFELPTSCVQAIANCRAAGGRVIAVGTTVARCLESRGPDLKAQSGSTQLFITPGFDFQVIDGLITNFHLAASSLRLLVAAFAGCERAHLSVKVAVEAKYRFFSYGDGRLIWPERS